MKSFRDYSLGFKFFSVVVTTTVVAAGLMIGGLFLRELSSFKESTENELASLSRIIGESSGPALDFYDAEKAQTILTSLKYRPRVLAAAIYTNGTTMATYIRAGREDLAPPPAAPTEGGHKLANGDIAWVEQVSGFVNEGTVYIRGDSDLFFEQIKIRSTVLLVTALPALTLGMVFLGYFLHRVFKRPVLELANVADEVTQNSDYSIRAQKLGDDELGHLVDQFNQMLGRIEMAHTELDERGQVLQRELSERTKAENELRALTETLEERIVERTRELEAQTTLQKRLASLSDRMRGQSTVDGLGDQVLSYLAETFQMPFGIFYFVDTETRSNVVASYAAEGQLKQGKVFAPGEGLVGQVAQNMRPIELTSAPPDYLKVSSGLGSSQPAHAIFHPLRYENKMIGTLELASFDPISDELRQFLDHAEDAIGVNLNAAHAQDEKEVLLEEMQRQQEELQVTNEELAQQALALEESREKLQANQEELRATNNALQDQAKMLEERQKQLEQRNREINASRHELETKANELSAANRYKSEFLANMSHELRTPLNSMLILSQMLTENRSEHLDEKEVEYAKTINHAGTDLLTLINDILDLSKVEAGRLEPEWTEVDLTYLTERFRKQFAHIAEEKNIAFHTELNVQPGIELISDQQRLEQIIRNLLANAIKFTSAGKVSVEVGMAPKGTSYQRLKNVEDPIIAFTIRDTGIGIPKEKQETIFHSFIQADGTTSRKFGGTGLGLSISREFTRLLGGEMHLESEVDKGSAFTLFLPVKPQIELPPQGERILKQHTVRITSSTNESEDDAAPSSSLIPAAVLSDEEEKSIPKLLIVEDDKHFAAVLENLARDRGFDPVLATDGRSGLNLAVKHRPQAIMLDIHLPEMDGLALIEHLSDHPETRHIPIHAMSVDDYETDVLRLGAIGFMSKPSARQAIDETFKKIQDVTNKAVANLLVVDDDEVQRNAIIELINADSAEVQVSLASNEEETIQQLSQRNFDCMILDLNLKERMSGLRILERISQDDSCSYPPVIVYTGMDVTPEEEQVLDRLAESIIIKGVASEERLLNEATLFLHRMTSHLPEKQQKALHAIQANKYGKSTGKRILVVDDDSRNIFAITNILEQNGMDVIQARNGIEALEALEAHPDLELVLMDIMMPEMNGYEAIQEIRKQEKWKDLPIIALTAKAMKEDRNQCLDAGANDYMTKPIDVDRLLSLLHVWLY